MSNLSFYLNTITSNPAIFSVGKTVTGAEFCKLVALPHKTTFTSYDEQARYISQLQDRQRGFNHILASRGMRLRSKSKGSYFYITEVTDRTVAQYAKQSRRRAARAAELEVGINQFAGTWEKYTPRELDRLVAYHRTTYK